MIYNLKNYIPNFDIKSIKVGDTIVTKSNGTITVENIKEWGWDYNYGNIIWFSDGNNSFSNKDLIQRNERNFKKLTKDKE
jgi:hypothetical protein